MSVTFSFPLRLSEVKYHWSKSGKGEKTVNLLCLMRSDEITMESVNLSHVLSITNESSTFGVRERVECPYYLCFNKVPVHFWLNFKLKREQEIAVESMLMNQDLVVVLPTAYGKS